LRVQSVARAEELTLLADEHGIQVIVGVEPDKPEDISDLIRILDPPTPHRGAAKVGRNEPCLCGSGKKYKRCCGG
jgi:SWIM/SEC-C metal-binding protein